MKRIISILLCLFLIGTLALSVAAAGSAHMSISSSSSTVYRGDTFTLTVSLSNDQPVGTGGVVLSYDSSVFKLVSGTHNLSNPNYAEVNTDNSCTFMFDPDTVVNGTIFTIQMQVKEDAPFGSYSISGRASLQGGGVSISCGISGASVTVGCKHSFGAASKVDDANHQSTCSVCGETSSEAHTWDAGTVTTAATCKDAGSKIVKCTACGAEKTESIPVTSDHTFGAWASGGTNGHYHSCSVCGKEESADHRWYTVQILEEATCQKTGRKSVMCEDCGASAEMEIGLADHAYGNPTEMTETQHTLVCTVCSNVNTADHSFSSTMEHDKQVHYYSCGICGYRKDQAAHVPGPSATQETDQVCTVCNRILKPKGAHQHEYVENWSSDENNHWHDCVDCPARDSELPHVFSNDCDADCNDCGFTRQTKHTASPVMESDATGHWYACLICGEKQEFTAHTPGPEATISSAQICTVCKFEIAPIVPHDHLYDSYGTIHFHKCVCGMEYEADANGCGICSAAKKASFPWWIVCIAEAIVFCGVVALILWKKKGPAAEEEPTEEQTEEKTEEPSNKDE